MQDSTILDPLPYRRYPEDYQHQREGSPSSSSPEVASAFLRKRSSQSPTDALQSRPAKRAKKNTPPPTQHTRMQRHNHPTMQFPESLSPTQQTRMQRQQHPTMRFPDSLRRFPDPMPHTTQQQRGPSTQFQELVLAFRHPHMQQRSQSSMHPPVAQMQPPTAQPTTQAFIAAPRPIAAPSSTRTWVADDYDPMWRTLSQPLPSHQPLVAFRPEGWITPSALSPVMMAGLPLGGAVEITKMYPRKDSRGDQHGGSARKGREGGTPR